VRIASVVHAVAMTLEQGSAAEADVPAQMAA
jgi:hypothetical protein